MLNPFTNKIRNIVSFKLTLALRKLDSITNSFLNYWPFGYEPHSSKDEYLRLADEVRSQTSPEIDEYEKKIGFAICREWLNDLALHTQVVIKESPLCYAHGRVLYAVLSKYISQRKKTSLSERLTIFETGTARGFSALCMAKALSDMKQSGAILTFDLLPHNITMYWNCIDDLSAPKTRSELLSPWQNLVNEFIIFHQGDTRIELPKVHSDRIHFAFLDGAHTYEDVMFEFDHIRERQMPGDIIVYDDYTPIQFPGIVRAVDEICSEHRYQRTDLQGGTRRGYVVAVKS